MQFRKETSKDKKFSNTPEDFNRLVSDYISETFSELLKEKNKQVEVQGRIYPEEIVVKLSLYEKDRIHCDNFSGSMDYDQTKKDSLERLQEILDAVSCMLEEFLQADGDIEMPLTWNEFDLENKKVFMMYSTENDKLETQAKLLLGDEAQEIDSLEEDTLGVDFFKEAEERFKQNLH